MAPSTPKRSERSGGAGALLYFPSTATRSM
jgi:hypothetical protein